MSAIRRLICAWFGHDLRWYVDPAGASVYCNRCAWWFSTIERGGNEVSRYERWAV